MSETLVGSGVADLEAQRAANIRRAAMAAVEAEPEVEPAYRCSCSAPADTFEALTAHHIASGHQGLWQPEGGLTVEVNGAAARLLTGSAEPAPPSPPEWIDPDLDMDWPRRAQHRIDALVAVLGSASKKPCPGKQEIDGVILDCPHRAVIKLVEKNEGSRIKQHSGDTATCKHTDVIVHYCLIHGIMVIGGDQHVGGPPPLSLFG